MDTRVSVKCLMPGATETEFFERAEMMDTKVGTAKKDDTSDVSETGFTAMMKGEGDVVSGWHNKLRPAIASVTLAGRLASSTGTPRRARLRPILIPTVADPSPGFWLLSG
jgi:short-subunit dehydrogenase